LEKGDRMPTQILSDSQLGYGVFLIASNVFMIPAITYGFLNGLKQEAFIALTTMVISCIYHLCQAAFFCVASFNVLQTTGKIIL
jgi:hypothetical protein